MTIFYIIMHNNTIRHVFDLFLPLVLAAYFKCVFICADAISDTSAANIEITVFFMR